MDPELNTVSWIHTQNNRQTYMARTIIQKTYTVVVEDHTQTARKNLPERRSPS